MNTSFPKYVPNPISVELLAERVGGDLRLSGVEERIIQSVASPQTGIDGSLVFCKGNNFKKIQGVVNNTQATVIVTAVQVDISSQQGLIIVEDPTGWYIRALNELFNLEPIRLVDSTAIISNNVSMGQRVAVGAGSCIEEGCSIGDDCSIGTNCYLGPGTIIESNVFIQNNVCIGGVGLGYHITTSNERLFFPHLGAVIIGHDVVVGSGTVVVRGELDDTIIGARTRIGNLVNIGHNVTVSEDCVISSNTCIAGGTVIGARCNIATGVTINAKLNIEEDCQIGLGSVVTKKVCTGQSVFGCPAKPLRTMRRF